MATIKFRNKILIRTFFGNYYLDKTGQMYVCRTYADGNFKVKKSKKKLDISKVKNHVNEEWKECKGFGGFSSKQQTHKYIYFISNKGRIKKRKYYYRTSIFQEKLLCPTISNRNVVVIGLQKNNKLKTCQLHRLVAKYFIKGFKDNMEIIHIDRNILNNSIDNLKLADHQGVLDTFWNTEKGKSKKAKTALKKISRRIFYHESVLKKYQHIKELRDSGLYFKDIAKMIGRYPSNIWNIINISLPKKEKLLQKLYIHRNEIIKQLEKTETKTTEEK